MTLGIVIFARMDSTRLPGKALLPLAGRPMLTWTMERCLASGKPVYLATSDRQLDQPLAELAEGYGLKTFSGDTSNVLKRAADAAEYFGLETLVRVSGDSPFLPPSLINQACDVHQNERPDLTTNVFPRTYPPGISVEVLETSLMQKTLTATSDPENLEHVTRFVYGQPSKFLIRNIEAATPDAYHGLHLAVDTAHDYEQASYIAMHLSNRLAELDEIAEHARQFERATAAKERIRA